MLCKVSKLMNSIMEATLTLDSFKYIALNYIK